MFEQLDKVTIQTDRKTAAIMMRALELYARIGIGQLDEVVELFCFGPATNRNGQNPSADSLQAARELMTQVKFALTGFESNASKGIGGEHVAEELKAAWEVRKAISHRLAWDRQPGGGMGVDFDEPLDSKPALARVITDTNPPWQKSVPAGMLLTYAAPQAEWVVDTEDGRAIAGSRSPQTAVYKAVNAVNGRRARDFTA